MKVGSFRSEQNGGRSRIAATVRWEDCDRPAKDIFFEADTSLVGDWPCRPEALLVACLLPAWNRGERRIAVDAATCPKLLSNLKSAIQLLDEWWTGRNPIRIEVCGPSKQDEDRLDLMNSLSCEGVNSPPELGSGARAIRSGNTDDRVAGMFLSGGIDSLSTLATNHQRFPENHRNRIKIAVFVHGFDLGFHENQPQLDRFATACETIAPVCSESDVQLIPLFTNIRHLDPDGPFWGKHFHGAALAAAGHALGHRLHSVSIASGDNLEMLPWGSHPDLDPLYGSATLQILHDGTEYTRLEKTAIVAEWPVALNHMRVCYESTEGDLNCGRCEKCVRTMLHLLVCGKLSDCGAFRRREVTASMLKRFRRISVNQEAYQVLIGPLEAMNRRDLVRVVKDLRRTPRPVFVLEDRLRQIVYRLDQLILSGRIARLRTNVKQKFAL